MWSVNRAADGMDILQRKSLQSLVYSETLPLANYNHCMAVLHQHHCGTTPEAQGTFLELSWYHPGDIPSAGWRSPLPTAGIFPEKNMWCQMDVRPACSYAILASLHQNLMRGFDFTWWDLATVGWERSSCCPSVSLLLGEERREECLSSLHSLGAESKPFCADDRAHLSDRAAGWPQEDNSECGYSAVHQAHVWGFWSEAMGRHCCLAIEKPSMWKEVWSQRGKKRHCFQVLNWERI